MVFEAMRGGAVWKLAGLITQRSQVQILSPLPRIIAGRVGNRLPVLLLSGDMFYCLDHVEQGRPPGAMRVVNPTSVVHASSCSTGKRVWAREAAWCQSRWVVCGTRNEIHLTRRRLTSQVVTSSCAGVCWACRSALQGGKNGPAQRSALQLTSALADAYLAVDARGLW